jgi:hypothetical protein
MLGHLHVCIEVDVKILGILVLTVLAFLILTVLAESILGL